MIAKRLVLEVQRLLQEGKLSRRKIAVQMGVSRGTVKSIAEDSRPCYGSPLREDDEGQTVLSPPTRCPICGGKVYAPCLLCEVRQRIADGRQTNSKPDGRRFEPLGLNLRPEHRARYEEVVAERREQELQAEMQWRREAS